MPSEEMMYFSVEDSHCNPYKYGIEIERKRFEKRSFYRKRFVVMLCHVVMKESTVLYVEMSSAACEKPGLILLFSAITRALMVAVAI